MGTEPREALSASLRADCEPVWAGLHAHPFLRELASGKLPLEKFRFFIEQDLLYLPDFARCMALGAAKSQTAAELEFFTKELDGTISLEIPNNRLLLGRLLELGAARWEWARPTWPTRAFCSRPRRRTARWRSSPPSCPARGATARSPAG